MIEGINKNSQPITVCKEGLTEFGDIRYSKSSVGNILAFGDAVDKRYNIDYDDDKDYFTIITADTKYSFHRHNGGNIYICDLDKDAKKYKRAVLNCKKGLVVTVDDRKSNYTKREVLKAGVARDLQRRLGYPRPAQLIEMLRKGNINNTDVSVKDVIRAIDIYGPDLGSLKGKTVTRKMEADNDRNDTALTDDTTVAQTLHIDLMYIEDQLYFVSVADPLEIVNITKIEKTDGWSLWYVLERHLYALKKYKFTINRVRSDMEPGVMTERFKDKLQVEEIIFDEEGGHSVPIVERKIRLIKGRVRGIYNTLPFKLPANLQTWLVTYVVRLINVLPTSNSLEYISPTEKLTGRRLDAKKDLRHGFADYVQVADGATDNTMKERTRGAIALGPVGNNRGTWYYFLLGTQKVVRRNHATNLPMPGDVIDYMNNFGKTKRGTFRETDASTAENENNNNRQNEEADEQFDEGPEVLYDIDEAVQADIEDDAVQQENQQVEDVDYEAYFSGGEKKVPQNNEDLMKKIFGVGSDSEEEDNQQQQHGVQPEVNQQQQQGVQPDLEEEVDQQQQQGVQPEVNQQQQQGVQPEAEIPPDGIRRYPQRENRRPPQKFTNFTTIARLQLKYTDRQYYADQFFDRSINTICVILIAQTIRYL